jgi:hypothetical protein
MTFNIFSSTLHIRLGLPHLIAYVFFRCICGQPIHLTRIHLLHCAHGGEHTNTHDAVQNFFASIAKDVGFYIFCEQTHVLLAYLFNHHNDEWILCL